MKKTFVNSLRFQMLFTIFGAFFILVLSTAYTLFSTIKMQEVMDNRFQQERVLKNLQELLETHRTQLLNYLSTRSSDALAELLILSQRLEKTAPRMAKVPLEATALREREVYALVRAYLDLADQAMEQKRGRNISLYPRLYDEANAVLALINTEISAISTERFRNQLDAYSRYMASSRDLHFWNLLFVICTSLTAIMLLLRSVEKVSVPMTALSTMATELASGNFNVEDISMGSIYEIDHVVEAFNRMKSDIHHYIEEIRLRESIKEEYMGERVRNFKMEALVRRMEIYSLQAQMNPHFLFNTLNTGMQLAIVEGADRTVDFMDYLSRLLRHNTGNKESIVSLRHEIEGLNYYFYILKIRFPKNLELILDCDPDLLDTCRLPGSILQPLVENSIIHAFKDKTEGARVEVRAVKRGSQLLLSVSDNGCGMSADIVLRLLHPTTNDASQARAMGLENVIHRLYFFYPDDQDIIQIDSVPGEGTTILIKLDMERRPCTEFS